jgi:bacterioferritin
MMNHTAFQPVAQRLQHASPRRPPDAGAPATASEMTTAIHVLNWVLAMTRVMALRCKREYHTALRLHSPSLAAAALEHANDVGAHAHRIRARIRELGGEVDQPADVSLPSQRVDLHGGNPLAAAIADDFSSARAALDDYREIAAFLAPFDPPTYRMLEQIIQGENERADDLAHLLAEASARPKH